MSDLISRQAAIEALRRAEALTKVFGYHNVIETIRDLPSADIDLSDYSDRLWRKAYEQGKADAESDRVTHGNIVINEQGRLKYCPMCGSRMKGEDDDTD